MKHPAKIDVAVLLIFFNRPEKIQKVFDAVREARPSRLYLYQDGARAGRADDVSNVAACRKIFEDIDWECQVLTMYQEKNYGCDPSEYIAQRWFFDHEEYGIVLEDDDVPGQAFFPFAKELLEKYKDDSRVAIICGMNNYDVEKSIEESYLFSKRGSIWGWASWRRFIDLWDSEYTWMDDEAKVNAVKAYCDGGLSFDTYFRGAQRHRASGRAHYESIMFAAAAMHNMLNIVPKYNMIANVGVGGESTHSTDDIRLVPRRNQKLFHKKTYDIEFPLTHPDKVERNLRFDRKFKYTLGKKLWDRGEMLIRRILFGRKKK